ncbi:uncharacterized protein A1O5_08644 [Cladophialophora psammophila CBS 110553]|uniref:Ketoreductase domain-containing protein n=1 Tax=Cladophialophora psammophila CBS 110553 TaxID=1182543 RepID=W9XC72_9EURO|nr:uncharacterized protein A1O5_08644 [Cladophialophora psammophila CBS 110553]EXJ68029.1 hypothetical protein A1O5_08644 [Cladophialophora psammophila CBS 110553]
MSGSSVSTDAYRKTNITDLFSLKGKTVVITGGARGLGLTFAWACAEVGANIAALDLLDEPHEDFALLHNELGVEAKFYRTDVTNLQLLTQTFAEVVRDFGHIHYCVTAAGIAKEMPFLDQTPDDLTSVLNVNVLGTYFTAQLAAKQMVAQGDGGSILLVSSIGAHCSVPGKSVSGYCASKGAVLSMCRAIADDLVPYNIRVNTISPGFMLTDMAIRDIDKRPNILEELRVNVPMKRLGDRRDLKGAVVLLLSNASAYTTGSDLIIDGGLVSH